MRNIDQLAQLCEPVRDGDLISKQCAEDLIKKGYVVKANGWNIVSAKGLRILTELNILQSE